MAEMKIIANPAYDVVFKYLLDDKKVAKKLLSLIIEKEVVSLELKPTEHRVDIDLPKEDSKNKLPIAVVHMDFAAEIRTADGEIKQLIIELQKAKLPTDIMRFRRYLGKQYHDSNNVFIDDDGKTKPLPILTIYFLGHYLQHTRVPVIEVNRKYVDRVTRDELVESEEFIETLTHDSIIIQIPALKTHRRNRLEQVLSVFDASQPQKQYLEINEADYPAEFSDIINRLICAGADSEVRETMYLEDSIVQVLLNNERELAKKNEALAEKDEVIAEKDGVIAEKDRVITEKDGVIAKKDEVIAEKDKAMEKAIDVLVEKTGISRKEAEKLVRDM